MTTQREATIWFLIALAAIFGTGVAAGFLSARINCTEPEPKPLVTMQTMPCHEDEALVWVDAPNTVRCVALDDLEVGE